MQKNLDELSMRSLEALGQDEDEGGGGSDSDDEDEDEDEDSCEQYHDDDFDDITLPSSLRNLPMPSSSSYSSSARENFVGDRMEGNRLEGGKHVYGSVRSGSVMSQVSDDGSYLSDGDSTITTTNLKTKVTPLVLYLDRSTPVN